MMKRSTGIVCFADLFRQVEIQQAFTDHTHSLHDDRFDKRDPETHRMPGREEIWDIPHQEQDPEAADDGIPDGPFQLKAAGKRRRDC